MSLQDLADEFPADEIEALAADIRSGEVDDDRAERLESLIDEATADEEVAALESNTGLLDLYATLDLLPPESFGTTAPIEEEPDDDFVVDVSDADVEFEIEDPEPELDDDQVNSALDARRAAADDDETAPTDASDLFGGRGIERLDEGEALRQIDQRLPDTRFSVTDRPTAAATDRALLNQRFPTPNKKSEYERVEGTRLDRPNPPDPISWWELVAENAPGLTTEEYLAAQQGRFIGSRDDNAGLLP